MLKPLPWVLQPLPTCAHPGRARPASGDLWQEVLTVAGPSAQGRRHSTSAPAGTGATCPGGPGAPKGGGTVAPGLSPALQQANPPAALAGLLQLFIQENRNKLLFPSHSSWTLVSLPSEALPPCAPPRVTPLCWGAQPWAPGVQGPCQWWYVSPQEILLQLHTCSTAVAKGRAGSKSSWSVTEPCPQPSCPTFLGTQ